MHTGTRSMLSVQATPDTANIRTANLFDEEHTVVPCVALVEGVLWPANAPAPELALAEEFGRFPDGWNGRPVVFDHPKVNGTPVSASTPGILEEVGFGQLFNTRLDGKKLKTEIWINNVRVNKMSQDVQDAVARLKAGDEMVEVSTGLFTMNEAVSGKHNGESFEMIWRNIVPDHLAVLPEGIKGACSVEDGCGAPRVNKKYALQPVMRAARMNDNASCSCSTTASEEEPKKGMFQRIMETAGNLFQLRGSSRELSDNDTRTAIQTALSTQEQFFWIMAVFEDGNGSGMVVYETLANDQFKLVEREFTIDSDGKVAIGGESREVRPVTQFVPIDSKAHGDEDEDKMSTNATRNQETSTMKDQLVKELIASEATQFSEDDRDWLSTLEESQLAKLSPVKANEEEEVVDEEPTVEEPVAVTPNSAKPVRTEDYIAQAPAEIREVLNSGLKLHRSRKDQLVSGILANARCKFTKEQLVSKPLDELESIASLATEVDFSVNGGHVGARVNSEDDAPPPPLALFDTKKRSA